MQVDQGAQGRSSSLWLPGAIILLVVGAVTANQWWSFLTSPFSHSEQVAESNSGTADTKTSHAGHDHGEHGHEHAGHSEENALELSPQAQQSIGLKTGKVKLSEFTHAVSIPGMVIERRGRSKLEVTAPITGIVTRIYPTEGQAVSAGMPLFELRLTHEEMVQAQADLLRTSEELEVIHREVTRLEVVSKEGAIAAKTLLERQYEQQKQEAALRAQKQILLLHGLTAEQVEAILTTRQLLGTFQVKSPSSDAATQKQPILQVQALEVELGQHVAAGDTLAVLADHAELLIEGEAFEQDAHLISQAIAQNRLLSAVRDNNPSQDKVLEGLKIEYTANQVQPSSRTLHFYVKLPNRIIRDTGPEVAERFVEWEFKPGQRVQLRVPVRKWIDRIVLPVDAIAQDGAENYVFRADAEHFDRQPVHVEHRDTLFAVIAQDGSLKPGDQIALNGAQQMHLALKNKSGGAIDPHAGHQH